MAWLANKSSGWEFFSQSSLGRYAATRTRCICRWRGRLEPPRQAPRGRAGRGGISGSIGIQAVDGAREWPPIRLCVLDAKRDGTCIPKRASAKPNCPRRRSHPDNPSSQPVMLCIQRFQSAPAGHSQSSYVDLAMSRLARAFPVAFCSMA